MTFKKNLPGNVFAIYLCVSALSACGESDLVEIHDQQLNDAIAADAANAGAAGLGAAAAVPDMDRFTPDDIDLSQYELVFNEEFNTAAINEDKWSTTLFPSDTILFDQLQFYVDTQNEEQTLNSPFSFNTESLTTSATLATEAERALANEQSYLSGILTTRGKFEATYGYIEARVEVENGLGIWPAIWMLGSAVDGLRPELYLLEYDGGRADNVFHNYNYIDGDGNLRSPGQQQIPVEGFSGSFHTIALNWTPEELLFYIDGQPSYRIVGENVPAEDMYLIINLAMGGIWPGAPDGTTPDPATFRVDYIRYFQLLD